jgi:uncharacterized membrane protein YoaT (DUF817 family)
LVHFAVRQGWASLFAGLMLAFLIVSAVVWQPDWPVHRYDMLFVAAVTLQVIFLVSGLETRSEAGVILLFHVAGTVMELFKTYRGSWTYPEPAILRIDGVPLFTGFMYASVGSYMVRVMRLCDMRFEHYPPLPRTFALAIAIYVNFFSHHVFPDMRWVLVATTVVMFGRVRIHVTIERRARWMPLPVAALLTAFFLYLAENVGTATGTWLYPGSGGWRPVSLHKLGSWYLLLYVSFALVTIVVRPCPPGGDSPPSRGLRAAP